MQSGVGPTGNILFPPFTTLIGVWQCSGKNRVQLRLIDYSLQRPDTTAPGSLALVHHELTISKNGEKLTGTTGFSSYELGVNPIKPGAKPIPGQTFGPFTVIGERLDLFKH
ncbi:unnamed protein product [Rotaria sordida]|uniref:Uncharacterized protein n=1 Tax=Rotaria sordida TaxID=392033 RepID=A0A814M247_9BILA|nr:unnamed protein product [Rotaria sordida]CAF1072931.1 unnamed protein product [Rotaria sordida]